MSEQTSTQKNRKRKLLGRGTGYLSAAGPQSRFILFLIFLLVAYTFLLRVFQKMAVIVALPVFLPISLITLLVFIGIVGTVYSHKFIGPMVRIRRAIEQLAEGDMAVSLRLRDTDDPMLIDLVKAIGRLSEHRRNTHALIESAARELAAEIQALHATIQQGVDMSIVKQQVDNIQTRQGQLERTIKACRKH